MKKVIGRWTYWLGVACMVVAMVMRGANALGYWLPPLVLTPGRTLGYWSFFHGSILFFATTIATASYSWLKRQNP